MNTSVMSLVGFTSLAEISAYQAENPLMHYELSYKMSKPLLDDVLHLLAGKISSVHACCPSLPIFPNFGSHDPVVLAESYHAIEQSLRTAQLSGAEILVLHPGYVCDASMPSANEERKRLLDDPSFKKYIAYPDGAICGTDYLQQEVYLYHRLQALQELVKVAQLSKTYGIKLAVENLNPRVGYLFQTPQEMQMLASLENVYLCLDVGHLWISSFVYGFPYLAGIQQILDTMKVVNCHLHSNATDAGIHHFSDDHHTFDRYSLPSKDVLELLVGSGANLVLEMVENFNYNTCYLLDRIREIQSRRKDYKNTSRNSACKY